MRSLELVRIEAGLHDWAAMRCGCSWPGKRNSAEHLPAEFIETWRAGPRCRSTTGRRTTPTSTSGEQEEIGEACLDVVRGATWILYEELAAGEQVGTSGLAYELLVFMDEQADRLAAYHHIYGAKLPPHLR